jgi:pilus assembly protein CpaC
MATAHGVDAFRTARSRRTRWFFVLVLVLRAATVNGQSLAAVARESALLPPAAPAVGGPEISEIHLLVGRSTVLDVTAPIARVSLSRPEIADALVTTGQQVLVHGKTPGTISMFVWDRVGSIKRYEVIVQRDLSQLSQQLRQLFPGEPISVTSNGSDVVVSGTVSSKYVIDKAAEVAAGYVEKKENIVNLLQQREGVASNQVMLRVRFAEVARSAMQELGISLFLDGNNNLIGRTSTQQFAAPFFDQQSPNLGRSLVFSDYLNVFLFDMKNQLGGVIKALSDKGLFQSLAEPNLVAQNGREASFLAGGEYPYPVVQGAAAAASVTIQFKEFGIRLSFTPTVLDGDTIHLKVKPEVSALDFTNAISFQGFRVPSLTTRRADTEIELQDGQTFAIAGLLNNTVTEKMQKVPGIGDVPILGLLFKSRALQKQQTELVVMITPQILRRGSTGVATQIPNLITPYMAPPSKTEPPPPPYIPQGGTGVPRSEGVQPASPIQPAVPAANDERRSMPQVATPEPPVATSSRVTGASQTPPEPVVAAAAPPPPSKDERRAAEQAEKQAREARESEVRQQEEESRRQQAEARAAAERERAEAKQVAERERVEARRAAEQAKVEARRVAEQAKVEARRAAEQAKVDAAKAEQARKQEERLAADRARKEAEEARKREAEDQKRGRALADAQARLKAAQALYDAEVETVSKNR